MRAEYIRNIIQNKQASFEFKEMYFKLIEIEFNFMKDLAEQGEQDVEVRELLN